MQLPLLLVDATVLVLLMLPLLLTAGLLHQRCSCRLHLLSNWSTAARSGALPQRALTFHHQHPRLHRCSSASSSSTAARN